MKISFFSLEKQNKALRADIDRAIAEVIDSNQFVDGPKTREFEEKWAAENEVDYCVLTSSGTSALEIALRCLGVEPNRSVITSNNSFMATASSICSIGALPWFLDTDESTNLNLEHLEATLERGGWGEAVLPVALYGKSLDFDKLKDIEKNYHIDFCLDLAQAHGCKYKGKSYASYAKVSAQSFYVTKTIGGLGEVGCLLTNDEEIAKLAKSLRNHGRGNEAYSHSSISGNLRGDDIQAAILLAKLSYYKDFIIPNKIRILDRYYNNLQAVRGLKLLDRNPCETWVPYIVPAFSPHRDLIIDKMKGFGVELGRHYPIPLNKQKAFRDYRFSREIFSNSEQQCGTQISLPSWPEISDDELDFISDKLIEICKSL